MGELSDVLPLLIALAALAGLALRLPSIMVFAGCALLGAFLGQVFGVYNIVLLGDLASLVNSVLDNEILIAVPLLVLSGSLLSGSGAYASLRTSLEGGRTAFLPGLLAAVAGGSGCLAPNRSLLERIAPSSAFLVVLGDLLERAFSAANLSEALQIPENGYVRGLMILLALPSLLLALAFSLGVFGEDPDTDAPNDGEGYPQWSRIAVLLIALTIPSLILFGLASPVEAGAVGVGLTLALKARFGELRPGALAQTLDLALGRSAVIYAVLLSALVFTLVFEGLGGRDVVVSILPASSNPVALLAFGAALLAILGLLILPLDMAVFLVPLLGPYFLEQGVSIYELGALFALAPLSGLFGLPGTGNKALRVAIQVAALAVALFLPVPIPASVVEDSEITKEQIDSSADDEAEGFTPGDNNESEDTDPASQNDYAPPNDGD